MKTNVNELRELIQKSTWNYSIPNVWLGFDEGRVKSKMKSSDSEAILVLDRENTVIPELKEADLYFGEPNRDLKPYLDLLEDEAELEFDKESVVFKSESQQVKIFTFESQLTNTFGGNEPNVDFLFTTEMEELYDYFSKLKKIASKFGVIYFTCKNGSVKLETTDKSNPYANLVSFDFLDLGVDKNFSLSYTFKYINSLFSFINPSEFEVSLAHMEEQDAGFIMAKKKDETEKYFIISRTGT